MFQPIEIYLKNGDVGFCTLSYSDSEDLRKQIESISKSEDVEKVDLYSHLPKLDLKFDDVIPSKCDYCNQALRDCSLCGTGAEG